MDRVKRSENGVIVNPFFLAPDNLVKEADEIMGRFKISGVPICEDGVLVGIITNRDMRFMEGSDFDQPIKNVMTKDNLVTAPVGTTLKDAQEILRRHRIEKLPIVDEHMRLKGLITLRTLKRLCSIPTPPGTREAACCAAAPSAPPRTCWTGWPALVEAQVDVVVLDSAHGHNSGILEAVARGEEALSRLAADCGQCGHRRGHQGPDRRRRRLRKGGHRPRLHLHHPRGGCLGVPQITAGV